MKKITKPKPPTPREILAPLLGTTKPKPLARREVIALLGTTKPREILARYLHEILIPAFFAAPELSGLEDALDAEIARVCDACSWNAVDEIDACCPGTGGIFGSEVEEAFDAIKVGGK